MVSRRSALGLMGAAAAATTTDAWAAGAKALPNKNVLYARSRGAPAGSYGMMWYTGILWGKRTLDSAVPLFHVSGFSFNKIAIQPDGGLDQKMVEVGFWCDPVTGKPADEWINPLNGLKCTPKHYKTPQAIKFDAQGKALPRADAPPGMRYEASITDPVISGDTVWIGENIIVKATPPAPTSPDPLERNPVVIAQTSLVTYTLRRKDLETPDTVWVPGTMNYQTMGGWYPWMRMGQESGQLMFQLTGRKMKSPDEMPGDLHNLIDERHPGWLKDPGV